MYKKHIYAVYQNRARRSIRYKAATQKSKTDENVRLFLGFENELQQNFKLHKKWRKEAIHLAAKLNGVWWVYTHYTVAVGFTNLLGFVYKQKDRFKNPVWNMSEVILFFKIFR